MSRLPRTQRREVQRAKPRGEIVLVAAQLLLDERPIGHGGVAVRSSARLR
jgi:hypothetical protein